MYNVTPITSPKTLDCGATCIKMLLAYYGVDVPLETLIEECNTRLIGCNMVDMKRAGNSHGLDLKPYRCDAEDIFTADRPAIVWWKRNHFVVFCGMNDAGKVVICNPDKGRFSVSKSVFNSFYSGYALFNGEPVDL